MSTADPGADRGSGESAPGVGLDPLRLVGWTALVVTVAVQVAGLYAPSAPAPAGVPGFDKLSHLAAFGVPAALGQALRSRWVLVALLLHALVSEPLQGWLQPHRQTSVWDLLADLVGLSVGVLLVLRVQRGRARRQTSTVNPGRTL